MKTFAAIILLPVISLLLYLVKTGSRWKKWGSFWCLWFFIPISFELVNTYVYFYRTVIGKIIFLITFMLFAILMTINIKKKSKTISIMTQIIITFNYPLILLDSWIVTCHLLWEIVKFFRKK